MEKKINWALLPCEEVKDLRMYHLGHFVIQQKVLDEPIRRWIKALRSKPFSSQYWRNWRIRDMACVDSFKPYRLIIKSSDRSTLFANTLTIKRLIWMMIVRCLFSWQQNPLNLGHNTTTTLTTLFLQLRNSDDGKRLISYDQNHCLFRAHFKVTPSRR